MKKNRRKALIFGLLGTAIAAAIAIPVGIVYGTPSESAAATDFDFSMNSSKQKVDYPYGSPFDATNTPAPPLDPQTGYDASKYAAGEYSATTFSPDAGVVGNATATITFRYEPIDKNGTPVYVTYALNVTKGVSKTVANFVSPQGKIPYGTTDLPKFGGDNNINEYLYSQGYGYKGVDSATNPQYVRADGTILTAAILQNMAVGETFSIQYETSLDKENFNDSGLPPNYTFSFDYAIELRTVYPPSVQSRTDATMLYGAAYNAVAPEPASNYVADPTPRIVVKTRPSGASNTPAVGQSGTLADISKYEAGTVFDVIYTYSIADVARYSGASYDYTITTTVLASPLTKPADSDTTKPDVLYEFGKAPADFGTGSVKVAPSAPVYADYEIGSVVGRVKTDSGLTVGNSPPVDATVVWADVDSYNSGTKFEVVYTYKPAPNYTGDTFTVTQPYVVTKQKVTIPVKAQNPENTSDYNRGSEPSTLVAPVPNAHFTLTASETKYFAGTTVDATKKLTSDQVRALNGNNEFTVQWTYTLDADNFEPASGTANTYTETTSFKVFAGNATYTDGKNTYSDVEVEYASGLPSGFVPSDLPEPNKNKGFVYRSTSYTVRKQADDKSTPAVGQSADSTKIIRYGAGAELLATFTFAPEAPGYTGGNVTVSRVLKIKQAAIVKPSDTSLSAVNLIYGADQTQPTVEPRHIDGFVASYKTAAFRTRPASGKGSAASGDLFAWSDFKHYAVGTQVEITWTYTPDVNHTGLPFDATQLYEVASKQTAATPSQTERTLLDERPLFGTDFGTARPANPNEAGYTGYVLDESATTAVVSTESANHDTSNGHLHPGSGTAVSWPDVKNYNAGTTFTVTYAYKQDDNHTATPFSVARKYTIAPAAAGAQPTNKTLAPVSLKFGTNTLTDAPPDPNGPASGYILTKTETKVSVQSGIPAGAKTRSPGVGALVVWNEVKTYNKGTKFQVIYTYESDANHVQATYAITKEYSIVEADARTKPTVLTLPPVNIPFGKNTYAVTPDNPNAPYEGFHLILILVMVTEPSSSTDTTNGRWSPSARSIVNWEDVKYYNAGTKFRVNYVYHSDPNYAGNEEFEITQFYTIT